MKDCLNSESIATDFSNSSKLSVAIFERIKWDGELFWSLAILTVTLL